MEAEESVIAPYIASGMAGGLNLPAVGGKLGGPAVPEAAAGVGPRIGATELPAPERAG